MAVTSVTTAMAGAINYTVVTDSSADWPSVANSTYFYDKADKLVHYKDSTGTVQEIFSGSGLTVGTTPVTSGTDGRVFFQAGGVVQQDVNFTFDNTLKRLTLKAVGTAATDIPFAVQDSAGTTTLLKVQGNQQTVIQSGPFATYTFTQDVNQAATFMLRTTGNSQAELGNDFSAAPGNFYTGALKLYNWSSVLRTRIQAVGTSYWADPTAVVSIGSSTNGARLDVRAQGALSTDIAFRVRNSADNDNLIESAGNGLIKFRTGAERIEINTSAADYKMSLHKFSIEMTKISTYASYFCYGGTGQVFGIGTNVPSHLLDVNKIGTQKFITSRFGNEFNDANQSDTVIKFTTAYCGGSFGGNPLGYLTVGHSGGSGVNNNAKSYFKFELLKNNTLAERASITSQSNLLLQTPTEDTNDVGVIYIPNGTAPTVALAGGGKLYVEGGALKFIGSSGTITTIAPA